jgi:hypothetical protein
MEEASEGRLAKAKELADQAPAPTGCISPPPPPGPWSSSSRLGPDCTIAMIKTTTDVIPETMAVMGKGSGVETKKSAKLMKAFILLNIARFAGIDQAPGWISQALPVDAVLA